MSATTRFLVLLAVVAATATAAGSARPDVASYSPGGSPLLGANLIQYRYEPPYCWGGHIVLHYDRPGVRSQVVPALQAMRAAGLETFRLFLYHAHSTSQWIPSASGRLEEPYRSNLVRFLGDIRAAGFKQVTVAFQPKGANDPTGVYSDGASYDPALFEENWGFIRDVRPLVKASGPSSTRLDLLNEGAPIDWDVYHRPGWGSYLIRMYANYVATFGADDVTISSVAKSMASRGDTRDDVQRIQNLVEVFQASGKPFPTWFDVHPSWDARALDDLRAVDAVLTRNGLSQPLVIGEERYNDAAAAAAVAEFVRTSARPVLEVMEWPLYEDGAAQPRCSTLPFRIDEYAEALRGGQAPKVLTGSVGKEGQLALRTPFGQPTRALVEGTYAVTVLDASPKHSFRLSGRSLDRRSGVRFQGTRTWIVSLSAGFYTYASEGPRRTQKSFSVLTPG